jgi:PKD repeat protein
MAFTSVEWVAKPPVNWGSTVSTGAPPEILTTTLADAAVNDTATQTIASTGSTPKTHTITSGSLPPGRSLAASTGIISGTYTTAGVYGFTITVTNQYGSDAQGYTQTVVASVTAPTITTTTLPGAVQNVAYNSGEIVVTGTGPFTFAVQSGTLPAGLSLIGAVIAGTPTGTGSSTFTIRATGPSGAYDDQSLTIDVTAAANVTTITSTGLPTGTVNIAYSYTVTATGSTPRTWTATGLPPGLTINSSSGAITGTPTQAGVFSVSVTATHTTAGTDTETFHLEIQSAAATVATSPWSRYFSP